MKRGILVTISLFFCVMGTTVAAQTWPSKPITLIYPFAAGSASDTLTRLLADSMAQKLGQPIIVENKPGAGGSIATGQVARATPDGYTLVVTTSGSVAVNPHIYKLNYDPLNDFEHISIMVEIPFVFVVEKNFAAQDYAAFKQRSLASPEGLTSANTGLGTQVHLTQEAFVKAENLNLNIVAYRGGPPAINDLLGGHVQSMMDNAASQIPYVTSGKVTALFVTSEYRYAGYPDVPTAKELGISGLVPTGWFGFAAPKGTPPEILNKVHAALSSTLDEPAMQKNFKDMGWTIVNSSPQATMEKARSDHALLGAVVRSIGLEPN